jgi:PAS domain S-box-containing protein
MAKTMNQPLRVLLVEDSEPDAALVLFTLHSGGFAPEHQRVDKPEAMSAALRSGPWDVVISDYTMPKFSGLEALALLQESGLDAPFIIVTGVAGEDDAVRCLHAGAADYLLKDRLDRLPSAVQRALAMAEERRQRIQAEQKLAASEQRLRTIFESEPECVKLVGPDGTVLEMNPAGLRMIEADSPAQVVGQSVLGLILPEHRAAFAELLERVMRGESGTLEFEIQGFKGTRRWLETHAAPLRDADGVVQASLGITRDITGRKQAAEALRASEERFRELFEHSPDAIFVESHEGVVLDANSAACRLHGMTHGQLLGRHVLELVPSAEREQVARSFSKLAAGEFAKIEGFSRTADGRAVPVEITSSRIVFSGQPAVLLHVRDITKRKRAEEAVRLSEAQLAVVMQNLTEGMVVSTLDGQILHWNQAAVQQHGFANEEEARRKMEAFSQFFTVATLDGEIVPFEQWPLPRIMRGEKLRACELRIRRLDADWERIFSYSGEIVHPASGPALAFLTIGDITERKRAEVAVQTSQRMLQLVLDTIPQGVFWKDRESRYAGCNALVARTFGLASTQSVVGMTDFDFVALTREQVEFFVRKDREVMDSGKPQLGIIEQATMADGSTRWLETNKVPLFGTAGNVIGILGTWQDLTVRKQTEETLQMMRFSVDRAGDSVFWVSRDGRILYVNNAACAGRGYSRGELLAMRIFDLDPDYQPGVWDPHFEDLKRRGTMTFETRHRAKDGRVFPVEVSANYVFINGQEFNFATLRDLSERRKQERLALRSQRMESIGTLAGGIAHDLNNALAPIMMSGELLRMEYPRESPLLDRIEASAEHAADMVRQLLTFAKGAEGARISVQPARLVREMENMMKGSFPKNIETLIKCDPQLPTVLGDATQLHQVLLNLCVNARDAMPRGGTLTLEAETHKVDAAFAESEPEHEAKPGSYVALRVRDTGVGIAPEILDRIFDPFFTTKDPDKGTGLGLSTVMGIVKGHGGFTQVFTQPGQGSAFTVFLPVDPAGSAPEPTSKAAGQFRGRGEMILFVDDEATVRNVARAVMQHLNFIPLIATDGADGLMQAAQHRTEIRAIITDLHMPRMDGLAFVREVRLLLPEIPIVVASGRMEEDDAAKLTARGVTGRLDKPFTQAQLAEALRNLLATKEA